MNEDWTEEDAGRLRRRYEAQQAGIDLEREMCVHDYVNGIGCDDCARHSRRTELLILALAILILLGVAYYGARLGT